MPARGDQNSDTGHVPLFGTWRRIYIAVIVTNLVAMALVYLFSRFPYWAGLFMRNRSETFETVPMAVKRSDERGNRIEHTVTSREASSAQPPRRGTTARGAVSDVAVDFLMNSPG
jgi:hypothetical protein